MVFRSTTTSFLFFHGTNCNEFLLCKRCKAKHEFLDNALAIEAKIAHPDIMVMMICADGDFMMNSQETETTVQLDLNLAVMILRDAAHEMIK